MTVSLLEREFPNDHLPLLRWLMFTGVSAFGFILAWYYGLFHLMLASDKTYISAIIGVLYILATVHCFVRTAVISREMDNAQRVFSLVSRGVPDLRVVAGDVVTVDGTRLPSRADHRRISAISFSRRRCRDVTGSIRPCCCAASPMRCAVRTNSGRSRAMR
jgi:hypothetical protein